jgi:hypothetical protein
MTLEIATEGKTKAERANTAIAATPNNTFRCLRKKNESLLDSSVSEKEDSLEPASSKSFLDSAWYDELSLVELSVEFGDGCVIRRLDFSLKPSTSRSPEECFPLVFVVGILSEKERGEKTEDTVNVKRCLRLGPMLQILKVLLTFSSMVR